MNRMQLTPTIQEMKARQLKVIGALTVAAVVTTACSGLIKGDPDERWADYKTWTKITEGRTGTGDPTGFIGNVHKGRDGYRDVYVNEQAKVTSAPVATPLLPKTISCSLTKTSCQQKTKR